MENLNKKLGNEILSILLIVAVIISLWSLIVDFQNTIDSGGVDLRNRVVAARLLIKGIDPYFFKWRSGMSDLLLDPLVDPSWPVSRATIPPTVLMLHAILANLPYFHQRIIWLIVQWGLLLSSLAIFAKMTNSQLKSKLILIIGLLFFSGSYFWRFHVERGQIYILYVFLLTCAYWVAHQRFKHNYLLSGFLVGLTASLRFPVILLLIPLLIYQQWKLIVGTILGLFSGIFISFCFTDVPIWNSYFSAMKIYENVHSGLMNFDTRGNASKFFSVAYPHPIEGMTNLAEAPSFPNLDTSFQQLFADLFHTSLPANIWAALLLLTLLGFSWAIYRNRNYNNLVNLVFLSGILMALVSEYFMPATRSIYNNIQWILCLSIIIINYDLKSLITNRLNIILLTSLFFGLTWMPGAASISNITMLVYTVLMVLFVSTGSGDRFDSKGL